jgi:hypothetical protein
MLRSPVLGFAIVLAATSPASAYGALAIGGNTAEAATKGIAVGISKNYATKEEAEAEAVKRCLAYRDAPAETVALCKLVEDFSHEWVVIALDPVEHTGLGWSIDVYKMTAERNAMDQCKSKFARLAKVLLRTGQRNGRYEPAAHAEHRLASPSAAQPV